MQKGILNNQIIKLEQEGNGKFYNRVIEFDKKHDGGDAVLLTSENPIEIVEGKYYKTKIKGRECFFISNGEEVDPALEILEKPLFIPGIDGQIIKGMICLAGTFYTVYEKPRGMDVDRGFSMGVFCSNFPISISKIIGEEVYEIKDDKGELHYFNTEGEELDSKTGRVKIILENSNLVSNASLYPKGP